MECKNTCSTPPLWERGERGRVKTPQRPICPRKLKTKLNPSLWPRLNYTWTLPEIAQATHTILHLSTWLLYLLASVMCKLSQVIKEANGSEEQSTSFTSTVVSYTLMNILARGLICIHLNATITTSTGSSITLPYSKPTLTYQLSWVFVWSDMPVW